MENENLEIIKELDSLDLSKNSKPVELIQQAEKDSDSYEHQQQKQPPSDSNSNEHEALSRINNNNNTTTTDSNRKDSVIFDLVAEESMLKHTKGFIKNSNSPREQSNNSSSQSAKSRISSLQSQQLNSSSKINQKIPHNMGSTGPDMDNQVTLPQRFVVKYLGFRETNGLWGIRYTRRPVDEMVASAKKVLSENTEKSLALLKVEVSEEGILVGPMPQNQNPNFPSGRFAIESISYGVQDLVYTRVFAMIVVKSEGSVRVAATSQNLSQDNSPASQTSDGSQPFRCHAFVCDSRNTARHLTYSLATAFQKFSENVASGKIKLQKPKRFAIDLRNPQDIEQELIDDSEA